MEEPKSEIQDVRKVCETCIYRLASIGRFVCSSLKSPNYRKTVKPNGKCDRWKLNRRGRSLETMALELEQAGAP